MCKLFVLDKNTWEHISRCKLFVLGKIYLEPYHKMQIICIWLEYLKPYNSMETNGYCRQIKSPIKKDAC